MKKKKEKILMNLFKETTYDILKEQSTEEKKWWLLCFLAVSIFSKARTARWRGWNTLEFRLQGTKINGENNTKQRHIVIKQEEKGVI